jgi:prophage antirepressor-like protein
LLSSRTKKAKKFIKWIKNDVLPLIRQNNIFSTDSEITKLQKEINKLEKENKILKNDLKVEKFPKGAVVYVVEEYDENNELYYKLGKTDDMNKRIKIYNTHSLHNKNVPHYVEVICPLQLETFQNKNKKLLF